jgi:hypothetical protein
LTRQAGGAAVGSAPLWFQKMDRNRDGDVSRKEFLDTDEQFKAAARPHSTIHFFLGGANRGAGYLVEDMDHCLSPTDRRVPLFVANGSNPPGLEGVRRKRRADRGVARLAFRSTRQLAR